MIKVYGASDDLIEVEGDVREEFLAPSDDLAVLTFSDGTALQIHYTGVWFITPLATGEGTVLNIERNQGPDSDNYSDVATLEGHDFKWAALSENQNFVKVKPA